MISLFDKKIKNLDIWDIGLGKLAVFFATLFIVSLLPVIATLDWYIYLVIAGIFAARPLSKFLNK